MVNVHNKDQGEIHEGDEIRVNPSPHMYQSIVENCADLAIYKYIMEFLAQDPIQINNKE